MPAYVQSACMPSAGSLVASQSSNTPVAERRYRGDDSICAECRRSVIFDRKFRTTRLSGLPASKKDAIKKFRAGRVLYAPTFIVVVSYDLVDRIAPWMWTPVSERHVHSR
jgi:hypothetical protein